MASPDVADYVGLELLDVDAQQLVEQAIASAPEKLPGWTPREGNTEVVLLELLAAMVEEEVYSLNRVGDGIVERVLRLMGVTRDLGAAATATVTFTASDAAGYTIPAGTIVRVDTANVEDLDLATKVDLTITAGQTTGTVAATATIRGVDGNAIPPGTALEVLDSLTGIESAVLATGTAGGRAPEDSAAFLARATPRLQTITTTLVRPQDVEAYVVSAWPDIVRVKVLDRYNPASGNAVGSDLGYVAVVVAAAGGTALDVYAKDQVTADLLARVQAGLKVNVIDPNITTVDVAVTVLALPGYSAATVQANVDAVLRAYLNPDTWPWSTVVRRNELIARADTAVGVDTVLTVTTPAADQSLTGSAPLARAGTITVTVQAPA